MKVLIDIGHPAHVHFFKHAIWRWEARGHRVIVTARDKDVVLPLLSEYGIPHVRTARARKTHVGFLWELFERVVGMLRLVRRERPDLMMGIGGTVVAYAGALTGTPSVVFTDTEHAKLANAITFPLATRICTPSCYKADLGRKHVRYDGYQELAYLHPAYFTPKLTSLGEAGVGTDRPLFLIRFVSWEAAHDAGRTGLSLEGKRELVQCLSKVGRVLVSGESPLPSDLESYQVAISPSRIHDLLYYSSLYVGEGATMASEAAILGTPSIYVNPLTLGYLEELEEYGLVHRATDERRVIELALSLASDVTAKETHQLRRQRMLEDKIDVTTWMVDFVERYLSSSSML